MLRHLSIKNYALIDNLEIDFDKGLSIITGETGAGKSILLGAIGLILGQRAELQTIKDAFEKCVIEGTFEIGAYKLKDFFKENDLDYCDQTILRREIKLNGSSRAFINDTPVNLNLLKDLGFRLIDVHSQHQNLLLAEGKFQLELIDAYAKTTDLLKEYSIEFSKLKSLHNQLLDLETKEKSTKAKRDFLVFQYDELEKGNLQEGELERIEKELNLLENAEEIKLALSTSKNSLAENELNIIAMLKSVKQQLGIAVKNSSESEELFNRIESTIIELSDINNEVGNLEEKILYDPQRINEINQRVNFLNLLLQKHQVKSDSELISLMNGLEQELQVIDSLDSSIEKLKEQISLLSQNLETKAKLISDKRIAVTEKLQKETEQILSRLGMTQAKLKIEISPLTELSASGKDKITYLFAANKGGSFNELSKVASGGEMSRLMLAVKSILARVKTLPAIIFDEIDTGVSGEVAGKLGSVLEDTAVNMQVIAITHLPQIACKGISHYEVYKYIQGNKTNSNIRLLSKDERINEIAKMLSGDKPSAIALENAKELLKI
ncbi:MAG: DNA repair protein RecN [Bacteroidota bacterium]|nr:DNA repair protein RecN [Bacteroidota bacterium]